jgi:hypothetical protein
MKFPAGDVTIPGPMFVDERVTLLDLKLVFAIKTHPQARHGWVKITPADLAEIAHRSRAMVHQRLVKLCAWEYLLRRGGANAWEWRVNLVMSDEKAAEAAASRLVMGSPEPQKPNETNTGDPITKNKALVIASPSGDPVTRIVAEMVMPSPAGDPITKNKALRHNSGDSITPPYPLKKDSLPLLPLEDMFETLPTVESQTVRKRARAAKPIDALWDIAPATMRARSSRKLAGAALERAEKTRSLPTIVAAFKRYLANDRDLPRSGGPGLHLWIRDKLENWLDEQLADELQQSELCTGADFGPGNAAGRHPELGGRARAALRAAAKGPPTGTRRWDADAMAYRDD